MTSKQLWSYPWMFPRFSFHLQVLRLDQSNYLKDRIKPNNSNVYEYNMNLAKMSAFVDKFNLFLTRHPSLSVERLYHNTDSFQESSISQKDQHPLHICPVVTITDGLNSNSNSSFDESPPHSSCEKDPRTPWMVHPKKRKNLRRGSCSSEGYCTGETSAVFSCNTAIADVSPCKEDWELSCAIIFLYESYVCRYVQIKTIPYHIIQSYQVWIVLDSLDHCEKWYWVDTHEENSFLYISDSDPNLDTKMWQQVSRADQAPCNKPLQPWQPAKHHHLQEGEQWPVLLLQVLWQFWCRGAGGPESPGNQFLLPMPWDIGWKVFNLWSNLKNMFLYLKLLKFRT